jgi:hypothetical protein
MCDDGTGSRQYAPTAKLTTWRKQKRKREKSIQEWGIKKNIPETVQDKMKRRR